MERFDKKSIFLGIGIGVIITSLISMVYFSGDVDKPDNTKQVQNTNNNFENVFKIDENAQGEAVQTHRAVSPTPTFTPVSTPTPIPSPEPYIYLNINFGDSPAAVGNKLVALGLINNTNAFVMQISKMGLDGRIEAGKFGLKKSMSQEEIIRIITTPRKG